MLKAVVAAALVLSAPGSALAQDDGARPTLHPLPRAAIKWLSKPRGEDLAAAYPEKAQRDSIGGVAILECQTLPTGRLTACTVLHEAPKTYGFGKTGLELARWFRLDPKVGGAALTGGVIVIPIVLHAPGGARQTVNYQAGDPSILVSISKSGAGFSCGSPDQPSLRCSAHAFSWENRPTLPESAALVRSATGPAEMTALNCAVGSDRRLTDCNTTGQPSSAQTKAMLGLVALMEAPENAQDGTPMIEGRVLTEFRWPTLRAVLDASILTRPH